MSRVLLGLPFGKSMKTPFVLIALVVAATSSTQHLQAAVTVVDGPTAYAEATVQQTNREIRDVGFSSATALNPPPSGASSPTVISSISVEPQFRVGDVLPDDGHIDGVGKLFAFDGNSNGEVGYRIQLDFECDTIYQLNASVTSESSLQASRLHSYFVLVDGMTVVIDDLNVAPSLSTLQGVAMGGSTHDFAFGAIADDRTEGYDYNLEFEFSFFEVNNSSCVIPCGDFDGDGDVDAADRTIQSIGWTGAIFGGGDTIRPGDCDRDGDVDTADQLNTVSNWTGANPAEFESQVPAVLVYDPRSGNVTLDATSTSTGVLIGFVLSTDSNFRTDNFDAPFADIGANTDSSAFQMGQTAPNGIGAGPTLHLGEILPAEMSLAEVTNFLSTASYSSQLGHRAELTIQVIPEPTAFLLAMAASVLMFMMSRCRRRDAF